MVVVVAAGVLAAGAPRTGGAQGAAGRLGPYERAVRLVEAGSGAEGRALTDSLVAAAAPGSAALAEALWWRATLAADVGTAERDLRRLVTELPASPRSGAASVRLAQLALLRGRPDEAIGLLDPVARGRAGEWLRPLGGYWLARARLDRRDAAGACAAIAAAGAAPVADVEVARQLAVLRARVPGCEVGGALAVAPAPAAAPTTTPAPAPAPAPAAAAPVASAPAASPPAAPPSVSPSSVSPSSVSPPSVSPPSAGAFAVQVAAYDAAAQAEALAARLRASGLEAFSEGQGPDGAAPPFRVKVGRHPTRAAAAASLAELRRRGLSGFVTTTRPAAARPAATRPAGRP